MHHYITDKRKQKRLLSGLNNSIPWNAEHMCSRLVQFLFDTATYNRSLISELSEAILIEACWLAMQKDA